MLTDLHGRLNRSTRPSDSEDWFDSDMSDAAKLSKTIDASGFADYKRESRDDKKADSYVKPVENYQMESKVLGKHLTSYKTKINSEKFKLVMDYMDQTQVLDEIFSEMKVQGNETREDEIIKTLLRTKEQDTDLNRKLLDLQTEIFMTESSIAQVKEVLRNGTILTVEKAKEHETQREKLYRHEKKQDQVKTL